MNMDELATASRYQVPVIEVVVNNQAARHGQTVADIVLWRTLFSHCFK